MTEAGNWNDDTPVDSPHGRVRYPDQWSFTSPFEGVFPHLYKDSRGFVTCGVGFLVRTEGELGRYPWQPNTQAAIADFRLVSAEPFEYVGSDGKKHVRTARHYLQFCKARITELGMRAVFNVKVSEFRRAIAKDWNLAQLPEAAQIAIVDMAYTLGAKGLSGGYPKLHRAVMFADWETVAKECGRGGVQQSRNDATAALFRGLVGRS